MLMMFGHALYKAPFERAMPFNDRDLMILVSPEYGIRLCNITTEQGETFEIKSFMISKKDVFNCEDFDKSGERGLEVHMLRRDLRHLQGH